MDPNLHPEIPGLPEDKGQAGESVAYFRRLKAQAGETAPLPPTVEAAAPQAAYANLAIPKGPVAPRERRRSPRFSCTGSVELLADGSDARMWGKLSDVSLHGCYVEMSTTFPVGTKVTVLIDSLGVKVRAQAMVRISYPFLGMGMCFSEIEPGQQFQLEHLLRCLAGERAIINASPDDQPGLPEILASADPALCLEALAEFYKKNHTLTRDEFYQITRRVRRS